MQGRTEENRQKQVEAYGAPLGDLFARVAHTLHLNQGKLAAVLGISAPMLSQLSTAHRIKLGNPIAVQRLQALVALSDEVTSGAVTPAEIDAHITEISVQSGGTLTHSVTAPTTAVAHVHAVQTLLRSAASSTDLLEAAQLLESSHPEIAEFLRVYGAGRTDEAIAHFTRHAAQ